MNTNLMYVQVVKLGAKTKYPLTEKALLRVEKELTEKGYTFKGYHTQGFDTSEVFEKDNEQILLSYRLIK